MDEQHPVTLIVGDDLRRSRVTVFFRYLLTIPHFVWLQLWTIAVYVVAILNWFLTLAMGRPPRLFHRFIAAYLRYQLHVTAYLILAANPFPGFTGAPGSYPLDLVLPAEPQRQSRAKTLFRVILSIPGWAIAAVLAYGMYICGFFTWWVALFTGRAPLGLRDLQAFGLRYQAQLNAYLFLITDRYPCASPFVGTEMTRPMTEGTGSTAVA